MIDMHTHILPGMDNGAKDIETSLSMLQMEYEYGIDSVVLTPSFDSEKENVEQFLKRRDISLRNLMEAVEKENVKIPNIRLGAEVLWRPNINKLENFDKLSIGDGRYMLLKLPFEPWSSKMFEQLYDMILDQKITPIFADFDCYYKKQKKSYVNEILDMDVPIQIRAESLLHWDSRRIAKKIIKRAAYCVWGSNCQDLTASLPSLKQTIQILDKRSGLSFFKGGSD